jgi:hypothetical protein
MCDILAVAGAISMMNVTCGTGPYFPFWACVSQLSFCGVPVVETLVF